MDSPVIQLLYSSLMLLAVVGCSLVFRQQNQRLQLDRESRLMIGVAAFLGAMVGAKLPFVLQSGWVGLSAGNVWFADGKTILGGIFGGYFAVELAKYLLKIRVMTGDAFVLPVAVAVGIGRIGCYIAGCCYGQITAMPWGVHFPSVDADANVCRHPTQLYEAAFHILAASVFIILQHQNRWANQRLKAYLLAYLAYRFVTEWLRPEPIFLLGLTAYQLASLLLAAMLLALWYRDHHRLQTAVRQTVS